MTKARDRLSFYVFGWGIGLFSGAMRSEGYLTVYLAAAVIAVVVGILMGLPTSHQREDRKEL